MLQTFCFIRSSLMAKKLMAKNAPTETAPQTEQKTNRPVVTFRHRGISTSVFKNDGNRDTTYFNVSIQNR